MKSYRTIRYMANGTAKAITCNTLKRAHELADHKPEGCTGTQVEEFVKGIGWVIAN